MGGYGPLLKMSRGGDCFSYAFDWGVRQVEWSKFFYRAFEIDNYYDWISLVLKAFFVSYSTYKTGYYCLKELKMAKEHEGKDEMEEFAENGFLADDVRVMGGASDGISIEKTIIFILSLGKGGYSIYKGYKSGFLFYHFGYAIGKTFSTLIQAITYWGGVTVFKPREMHLWELMDM